MVTLIAEHWVSPGQMDNANKIFQEVGSSVSKAPGFVSRKVMVSQKDSTKITTVTSWESQEALNKWREVRSFSFGPDHIHRVFAKETVDIYDVTEEI